MPKKYVDLTDLVAGLRPGVGLLVSDARLLAETILNRCEAVDPIEDESEWERYAAQQDHEFVAEKMAEMEADHDRIVADRQQRKRGAAKVDDQAWRSEVQRMGLAIREPSPYCIQIMRHGKVFAEWWPSKGTTMHQQKRGQRCADSAAFVHWLRTLVA